jgi:6-phosphogluconolactonase
LHRRVVWPIVAQIMSEPIVRVLRDSATIAAEAAKLILDLSNQALEAHGSFSIALAGGSTPKALYELLASDGYANQVEWERWEVYFGDERCVPPEHAESNYRMAREALLSRVPIPPSRVFRMKGELEPEQAAKEYGQMLKARFGEGGFDVVLLGMGNDGHTASLFPGTPALSEKEHRCVAQFVEKSTTGPSWRVTLTAPFINRAETVVLLISGAAKAQVLQEVLEGDPDPQRLPVQLIDPSSGKLIWLVDVAAAGMAEAE